jgi:hypothetical protein
MVAYVWKWPTIVFMILYCLNLQTQIITDSNSAFVPSMPIGIFATALVVVKLFWVRIGRTLAMTVFRRCWIPLRRPTLFATIMLHFLGLVSIALVYYDVHKTNGALLVSLMVTGAIFWGMPIVFFVYQYFCNYLLSWIQMYRVSGIRILCFVDCTSNATSILNVGAFLTKYFARTVFPVAAISSLNKAGRYGNSEIGKPKIQSFFGS